MKIFTPFEVLSREALDYALERTRQNMIGLASFPERCENGRWISVDNGGWVGGHWVGLLWLAFAATQDPAFEKSARLWATRLAPRRVDMTTHDLGFLFNLSHVLGYELTGDESLKALALMGPLNSGCLVMSGTFCPFM